jgi:hypothetical protein
MTMKQALVHAVDVALKVATIVMVVTATVVAPWIAFRETEPPPQTPSVQGMHLFELRDGATHEQVARLIENEFVDAWPAPEGGVKASFWKADRGEQIGKYMLIWEVDSLERRDEVFGSTSLSPEQTEMTDIMESRRAVHNAMSMLLRRTSYTDYALMSH